MKNIYKLTILLSLFFLLNSCSGFHLISEYTKNNLKEDGKVIKEKQIEKLEHKVDAIKIELDRIHTEIHQLVLDRCSTIQKK